MCCSICRRITMKITFFPKKIYVKSKKLASKSKSDHNNSGFNESIDIIQEKKKWIFFFAFLSFLAPRHLRAQQSTQPFHDQVIIFFFSFFFKYKRNYVQYSQVKSMAPFFSICLRSQIQKYVYLFLRQMKI